MEMEQETLPKTGSAYPRVAAVGLALALAGLTLARKAR
jgi:LPXTG-motif cell wall-anchored protein